MEKWKGHNWKGTGNKYKIENNKCQWERTAMEMENVKKVKCKWHIWNGKELINV